MQLERQVDELKKRKVEMWKKECKSLAHLIGISKRDDRKNGE